MSIQYIIRCGLFTILLFGFYSSLYSQEVKYRVIEIQGPVYSACLSDDSSFVAGTTPPDERPWVWKDGVVTYLPMGGSIYRAAVSAINNNSISAGWIMDSSLSWGIHASVWQNGTLRILDGIPGCVPLWVMDINTSGTMLGKLNDTSDYVTNYPFIYSGSGLVSPLRDLPGFQFHAINEANAVAAKSWSDIDQFGRACIYDNGNITYLGGPNSAAYDINNLNHVLGENGNGDFCLWKDGTEIPIGLRRTSGEYAVGGLNDFDEVVGNKVIDGKHYAVVWKDGITNVLDSLIDPALGMRLKWAYDINNKGEIICNGDGGPGGSYYLLVPDSSKIIKPKDGDIFIAGEINTIKWLSGWDTETLNLEYSTDGGQTYQPLAQNIPNDSSKYIWDVPDSILSTKCFIKIIDGNTSSELEVSEKFGIRPYILTKTDTIEDEFVVYSPIKDMWGFENDSSDVWPEWWWIDRFDYQGIDPYTGMEYPQWIGDDSTFFNAIYYYYPDWSSFVRAFSVSACYRNIEYGVYNIKAVKKWYDIADLWAGSCFGIAGTNALAFMHRVDFLNKFPSFPYFQNPVGVTSDSGVINAAAEIFSHQFGNPSKANDISGSIKTTNQTLRELKSMFRKSNEARTISLINQYGNGAHTILPYKLEKDESLDYIYYLYVYDNSYSYLLDAKIRFDTTGYNNMGTWEPMYGWANWGGNYGIYMEVPSDKYIGYAELEENKRNKSDFDLAANEIEVLCSQGTDILIKNAINEQIGHINGQVINEMPGAFPLRIKNGAETPPYGYSLSENTYSIETSSFTKPKTTVDIFTMDKIFTISRQGTSSDQVDKVYYTAGQRIGISNSQGSLTKRFKFSEIISDEIQDKMFIVRKLDMVVNDSLDFVNPEIDQLKITNIGSGKDYEIELQHADNQKMKRFLHASVNLPSTSNHILIPDWTDINSVAVTILVDIGNNGTIDDTLRLENEFTGINDDQGSLIPTEYKLEQNYPNPFNNYTVIRYVIPQEGLVTLKIYDIIGEEVVTLVNETKQVGNYQVTFNSDKLTSGVYLYRLQAGDFIQTKKMILLK